MLASGASDDVLVRAAASSQTAWMTRTADAAGGVLHRESDPAGSRRCAHRGYRQLGFRFVGVAQTWWR